MRHLDPGWYAVQVRSQSEKMVAALLKYKGYETFLPAYPSLRTERRNVEAKPLFPGYLFCRVGESASGLIVATRGVIQMVGCGNVPQPVPDSQIDNLKLVVSSGVRVTPWVQFEAGMHARLIDGPLKGCTGVIEKIDGEAHLIVSVELLRRSVSVRIERDWVEAAGTVPKPVASSVVRNPDTFIPRRVPAFRTRGALPAF